MKRLFFVLAVCLALVAHGQVAVVTSNERVPGIDEPGFYPQLSQDGRRLVYSSGEAQGLRLYDFDSHRSTTISDGNGAGLGAKFGPDGNVYYVTQALGAGNLVYRTGHCYNVAQHTSRVVLEAQHGAVRAVAGRGGVAIRGSKRSYASSRNMGTSVYTEGAKVYITTAGKTVAYSPVESWAGYIWPSLSPDGKKVAFVAAEKGVVVIDLTGRVLAMLGKYQMPAWYNNDYIVAQNAHDDGHQFTSSQIMLLKADGTCKQALTASTSMTMQPASAAGRIVYTTIDGLLYEMTIAINPQNSASR